MNENKKLTALCNLHPKLWQWLTIDPTISNWWTQLFKNKKILGLKIHPTWQHYELTNYLHEILEIARINNWAILTHSDIKDPYISIEKSIKIADKYPDVPVIFAHLGNGFSGYNNVLAQIEYLSRTKNENTFVDTSSLAIHLNGLLEESINKIGSHRILFGTDLPLHLPESQLARIFNAKITIENKENILWKNAISLFPKLGGE
jgi:predicted TIM-barrel fold metal-dependent hydrolase